ncbi:MULTISPECIES: hypothetical protein [Protofrankia]|uniref:Uncharacterized protein n=1 Tax=Candidatus Protofrankia datiscae TaxID=2716812 RepID=F8AX77_9ACTN|nr:MULTISPECIES: hypothetical protein [Protofrankia]AEH08426.1 hypothetical protein FsymDg_0920 [Candidatus Protofrankia datiscae]
MRMLGIVAAFVWRVYPPGLRGVVRPVAAVPLGSAPASVASEAARGFADDPRRIRAAAAHHSLATDARAQAPTMRKALYVPGPSRGLLLA